MINKTVTVTMDQRFKFNSSHGLPDVIVVSKGDVLKVEHHGIINKEEYVMLPDMCVPNRILLNSALMDGWIKINN